MLQVFQKETTRFEKNTASRPILRVFYPTGAEQIAVAAEMVYFAGSCPYCLVLPKPSALTEPAGSAIVADGSGF